MATIEYIDPIASMSGRLNKQEKRGAILRQKHYKDPDGRVIAVGTNESYCVRNPRDYKKNPPQGEERRNISIFQEATRLAMLERQDPERLSYWKARFEAQLRRGEPDAPIDPRTNRPRIYRRFHIFVQSAIQRTLKTRHTESDCQ